MDYWLHAAGKAKTCSTGPNPADLDDGGDPPSTSWHWRCSTYSRKTSARHPALEDHWLLFDLLTGVWTWRPSSSLGCLTRDSTRTWSGLMHLDFYAFLNLKIAEPDPHCLCWTCLRCQCLNAETRKATQRGGVRCSCKNTGVHRRERHSPDL